VLPLSKSILVAIFCMAVVFVVLGVLWAIVRIFSLLINSIEQRQDNKK
jgi:Na+-transporting methylmalonyl-CoA/oxaloacetate decarboxylase gamma subunit